MHSSHDKNVNVKDGIRCIFVVGGLGSVDSVDRYFVYKVIYVSSSGSSRLQYFNLAEHLKPVFIFERAFRLTIMIPDLVKVASF